MQLDPQSALARIDCISLLRALPFRAYGDPRYYLNCIALIPAGDEGVLVMATDGYTAVCLHDLGGRADRPLLLPIGKAQKAVLKKGAHVLVSPDGTTWVSDEAGSPMWLSADPLTEGAFPDLRNVIGDVTGYVPGLLGPFNPSFLVKVKETFAHFSAALGTRFYNHPMKPGVAIFTLGTAGFGVVMGMNSGGPEPQLHDSVPAYFRRPAQVAIADQDATNPYEWRDPEARTGVEA